MELFIHAKNTMLIWELYVNKNGLIGLAPGLQTVEASFHTNKLVYEFPLWS